MKVICLIALALCALSAQGQQAAGESPDGRLRVEILCDTPGKAYYSLSYDGRQMLLPSQLGFLADIGNFADSLSLTGHTIEPVAKSYRQNRIKKSEVAYKANLLTCDFMTPDSMKMQVEFSIADDALAFRYLVPRQDETGSIRILEEKTGFRFPEQTTVFLTPQSDPMIGWKRTKPSYEEEYILDAPLLTRSQYGHGFTFPGLFRIGGDGWVLVSETGVNGRYCGSRLSDAEHGTLRIAFPMPGENNGNGTSEPAFSLPGATPWRTLAIGADLRPIVESTVTWDLVEPRYDASSPYEGGRGTWSWILWQDRSINAEDQRAYVDLAADMGYEFTLVDNWWDRTIGREGMKELADYAASKGVGLFIWYSSSGWWNDIEQSPVNIMSDPVLRKKEMKWLREIGAKGIKVDFFGGDKQETMRLYEDILADADEHGLMVIFHGCTLPRGWERMYPNYVGSEAVLASENMIFQQHFCDLEAQNACLHPFVRNAVGCMEFGGTFLNRRLDRTNSRGNIRRTTDGFELATAVLFQNPVQNFALAPNNLTDAPAWALEFMRGVPTEWDDVRFIDGYPGRYAVIARRAGSRWYVAAANALDKPLKLNVQLPEGIGSEVDVYHAGKRSLSLPADRSMTIELQPADGLVVVAPLKP